MRLLLAAALLSLVTLSATGAEAKIQNLKATDRDSRVSVHFTLDHAFDDPERVRSVQSGLATSLSYVIEIYRDHPWWFDEGVVRHQIDITATYDSVTREFLLRYKRDNRLVRSETFTDLKALERRMSEVDEPDLFFIGKRTPYKLKVRVKADLGQGWLLYVMPWQTSTKWRTARLTMVEPAP